VHDSSSLITLNKQLYPGGLKFLLSAYNQVTICPRVKFYWISIQDKNLLVATDIFDHEIIVDLPVNSEKGHYFSS